MKSSVEYNVEKNSAKLCSDLLEVLHNNIIQKQHKYSIAQVRSLVDIEQQIRDVREFALTLQISDYNYDDFQRGQLSKTLDSLQSEIDFIADMVEENSDRSKSVDPVSAIEFADAFQEMLNYLAKAMRGVVSMTNTYQELSTRDPLTGCHNRHAIKKVLPQCLKTILHNKSNSCVLLIDIDKFEDINRTMGYQGGDVALRAFVRQIYTCLRLDDICCRYDGDEFLVVVVDVELYQGVEIAERIRKLVESTPIRYRDKFIKMTTSIGVAELYFDELTTSVGLQRSVKFAREKLVEAKNRGGNKLYF